MGDPVVFLHGQPGAGIEWHRVIDRLRPSVDAIAPDRPGYGNNPLEAGGFDANTDWLIPVVEDHGGGRPVAIVAHSWAGGVALAMALRRPDLTGGIVLVSSIGPGGVNRVDRVLAHPAIGPVTTRTTFTIASPVVRWLITRFTPAGDTRAAMLDSLDANRTRGAWRAFVTEQVALVDEVAPLLDRLGSVTAPVTVLAGSRDRIVPAATAAELVSRLPNATLVSVPRGGHQLHRTHPRLVADVVRRVLDQSRPS